MVIVLPVACEVPFERVEPCRKRIVSSAYRHPILSSVEYGRRQRDNIYAADRENWLACLVVKRVACGSVGTGVT